MNLINIIEEIEKVDADVYERISPRRRAMKSFFNMGSKIAIAAVPLSLGTMLKKAYGQTPSKIIDVLNFALTLEHLEYRFYVMGVEKVKIPSGCDADSIKTIRADELKHVKFLQTVITSLGGTPVAEAKYDFTAKGTFPTVFSDYATFLAVAQALEDTGVRAYKGQAGNVMESNEVLTAALRIHSVEARHASHIRWMRQQMGVDVKPWITGNQSGIGPAVNANYAGEETDTQAGIVITNINGKDIPFAAATESFDEPLTKEQVVAIVTPFFA